jgi:hypothetical protein
MANLIFPQSQFLDVTGRPSREWVQWLQNPDVQTITAVTFNVDNVVLTLPLEVIYGGTGLTTIPTNGQLLIGNGVDYTLNTLTAGTGLTITNAAGSITTRITNTGVTASAYGSASSVTTLTVNAQGQLTVAGSVAIAIAASQITSGTLAVARGGTGLTSYTIGDIIYASGITTLSQLADIAVGNALISGGVGVAPSYGKIGLTTHVSGTLPVANGGTGLATLAANRIPYGNGTAAYQSSANLTFDGAIFTVKADIVVDKTITAPGTTGAQTINKTTGSVNFAIAATSLVVTNSLVTTSSIILATVASNDTTMKSVQVVAAAGSFTLYANAAATAETRVNFLVLN